MITGEIYSRNRNLQNDIQNTENKVTLKSLL